MLTALPRVVLVLLAVVAFGGIAQAESVAVESPGGAVTACIELDAQGRPLWRVEAGGVPIIAPSPLGLQLFAGPDMTQGFRVAKVARREQDTVWRPVYGERAEVRDCFREAAVTLETASGRVLVLTLRAYDEGAAICYTIPKQPGLDNFTIRDELTSFCFTGDFPCYAVYSAQGVYERVPLSRVKPNCERPLTVLLGPNLCAAVAEARLVDYARMRLQPADAPHAVRAHLGSAVRAEPPYSTPWRVVMVGSSPGQLLERNYLLQNLNAPCAIADTSWIKPGKVIRETTLTTEGGMACVDFAAKMGLQYIEYDAGWYGHEYDDAQDATTITRDDEKGVRGGKLDLHAVIAYGKSKGIGVWVYVNRRQLERQLDEILPLYRQWGIAGVKYGFVRVGDQRWTTWLHEAIRKAADHQLMVDVHDEYRPTGYERTYPNFLTAEGVGGNETMPTPEHNCTLPFTRFLCGAADCTICWYTDRIKTTHAHQLAAAVVMYSPLQFVFWYDKPHQYQGEPELEFFKHVPATWDETRVLRDDIGVCAAIARRRGGAWFVGVLNAQAVRDLDVTLDFLAPDQTYALELYADAAPQDAASRAVRIEKRAVKRGDVVHAALAANGGCAMRLTPAP